MKLLPCLLLLCAMTLTGCGKKSAYSSTSDWIRFKSPEGPYSVLMPGKPVSQEQNVGAEVLVVHTSEIDPDQGVLTGCYGLPPDFSFSSKKMVNERLDLAMQAIAGSFSGTILDKKSVIIDNIYPSRDATIKVQEDGKTMILRIRLVLTPDKLIQVVVIANESESSGPAIKKCLDSIKIDLANN